MINQGIALSLMASVLFAMVYYLSAILAPLDGIALFAWRIALSLPVFGLILYRTGQWPEARRLVYRLLTDPVFFGWSALSAFLFGVQAWIFVWAPLNQKAVDVSMGYFLLPFSMVVTGKFIYKERLSAWQ